MEKVILPIQTFFRCISEVSKLVLGCIIFVQVTTLYVNYPYLQLDIYSKEIEYSAAEAIIIITWAIQYWKYWKKGNHSDEALQREEEHEGGREECGNNLGNLPPTKSWNLSLPSQCRSLQHEIKKKQRTIMKQ